MADTLNIANIFQLLPYEYDFEDSRGEKEWAMGFVTKLLATRAGNCHSLPFLYKILAEELETEAYLSLLPHHIYLQIPFKRPPYGTQAYFNTELTSKTFPLDAWIMTAGYVSIPSIQTKMYMDRLDTKQSLALCLVDLAKGFEARNKEKLSAEEIDQFMQNCVDLALETAPNLITARLLQVELNKREFERTKNKIIYKQLETNITQLFADGYLELPELMYSEQPKTAGLDSTYTPFAEENIREGTPTGKGKVLTLSNGRYDEFKNAKRIETIGSVRFNTEKNKIVGFGENKRQVEVVSRFLSVDPLAQSYPFYTPYQFAGNQPIVAIDLDGAEPDYMINKIGKLTEPMITLLNAAFNFDKKVMRESTWIPYTDKRAQGAYEGLLNSVEINVNAYAVVAGNQIIFNPTLIAMPTDALPRITHEESHRQDLRANPNSFYFEFVLFAGVGLLLTFDKQKARNYIHTEITAEEYETYGSELYNIYGKNILNIMQNSSMMEQDKVREMEKIGNKFRRDYILQNQINKLSATKVNLQKELSVLQSQIPDKHNTQGKRINKINEEINTIQQQTNELQNEQQTITNKCGC